VEGAENAGPENAGPSRNAASLYCVCVAIWTIISSERINVLLSLFLTNTLLLRTSVLMDDLRAFRYSCFRCFSTVIISAHPVVY